MRRPKPAPKGARGSAKVYRSKRLRAAASLLAGAVVLLHPQARSSPLAASAAAQTQERVSIFPTVSADALDKQHITLPAQLEGEANLLLLSFAADQGNQLETWTASAQALQHTIFSFRAYRIPVAERENALFRWWANASLRSEETDPELWHWVVPIYVEKETFRAQLGIADEKSIVALLVDKSGRILWRATGASSPETRTSLKEAAAAAQ